MKKIVLLSIALLAGLLIAQAQKNFMLQERFQRQNTSFEYPDFENLQLPKIIKSKSGQDLWNPDTVCLHWWWENNWVQVLSYTYTYDSNNNLITKIERLRDKSINSFTYTYDFNNNILSEQHQRWVNDSWVDGYYHFQYSYTYDSNNNILTKTNGDLYTYTYDFNNNMLTELQQKKVNNSYENSFQKTFTYDSNNNLLTLLSQTWNDNLWVNYKQFVYTYDSDDNIQTLLYQIWENSSWKNYSQFLYTHDSNNNLITELHQSYSNNSWVYSIQYRRTYDENGNGISAECLKWEDERWQPTSNGSAQIGVWLYYNNMQNIVEEVGGDKMTASYKKVSGTDTGIKDVKTESPIQIFSAGKTIHINNQTGKNGVVTVYRIDGVKVVEQTMLSQTTTFEMPVSGFYLVSVRTGDEKPVVEKVVVR